MNFQADIEVRKVPLILEGEFQVLSLVENNALASEEEPILKEMQVDKKHPKLLVQNVLVGLKTSISPLSLEDELSSPTLECDEVPLILEGEFQVSSLV